MSIFHMYVVPRYLAFYSLFVLRLSVVKRTVHAVAAVVVAIQPDSTSASLVSGHP